MLSLNRTCLPRFGLCFPTTTLFPRPQISTDGEVRSYLLSPDETHPFGKASEMATLTVGIRHQLHGAESNQKSSGDRHGHNVEEVEEELLPRVLETAMSATLLSQE